MLSFQYIPYYFPLLRIEVPDRIPYTTVEFSLVMRGIKTTIRFSIEPILYFPSSRLQILKSILSPTGVW
jgi:hypothetical protein